MEKSYFSFCNLFPNSLKHIALWIVMFLSFATVNAQTIVFEENFSTWSGWSQFSAGTIEYSSEQSRSEGFSLKKIQNNDPNGGWKALGATIGREYSFEGWIYRPSSYSGGAQDRISIANADFNGYGFRITGSEIRIEVRENGNPAEDIASANWNRTDDAWYRFVFVSNADNTFTLSIYDETATLQASVTSSAHSAYNIFDRIVIHGGHHFYVDDLSLTTVSDPVFMAREAGPAGVGNRSGADNQPQLAMWLDASSLNLNNADDLATWYDLSGNGNHASQLNTDNMPVWLDDQLNGNPVVRFRPTVGATERSQTWLNFDGNILVNTPYSVFSVAARREVMPTWPDGDPNPNEDVFIIGGSSNSNNQNLQFGWRDSGWQDGNFSLAQWGNDIYLQVDRDNDFHVLSATRNDDTNPYRAALFYNGNRETSGISNTTLLSSYPGARLGSRAHDDIYSKVDISEFVAYADFLNPARRIIVDNYLAFKYGLSLDDKEYHFTSASYTHNFIGIGHSDGYKHIENAGKSGGGLYITENAASLDETDEFVFAAHNGTTHAFSTANYADPNITQRWARDFYVYRIQNGVEGAGSTSIRIGFDFDEADLAITPDKYYYLMYRAGTSGDYAPVPGAMAAAPVDGETIWFTLGNSQFQSGYYAIAETDLEPVEVIARGGPAGIGNADGSNGQPELVMWLDASKMELNHNDKISVMTDFSGNNNHAEQPIPANQPTFLAAGTGGFSYPVVSFDSANEEFLPFDGNILVNTNYTFSFVGARRSDASRRYVIGGTASSNDQNLHVFFNNSSRFHSHQYGNDHNGNMVTSVTHNGGTDPNSFGIFTALLQSESTTAQRRIYQNNELLDAYDDSGKLTAYPGAAFARYRSTTDDLQFSEAMVFAEALNDAQNIILNNHLHYKYGIDITNLLYTAAGSYTSDVVGIGRTDVNNIHRETTGMGGGLYLGEANNSLTQSNQFVFASHSGTPLSLATSEVPAGIEERLLRDYYIQRIQGGTVNAGTTDIRIGFDFEEINQTAEDNIYYLLYRAGTSGDYQVLPGASGVPAGGKVWFTVESDDFSSGYYTIGRSDESPVIWYTYQSGGDWSDPGTWSLNSNPTDYSNPLNEIPSETDRVVILPSITVRADINDIRVQELDVRGTLNLENSTGHNFGVIKGQGRIRLNADQLTIGDLSQFVAANGGTVEYYGVASFALNSAGTYNHLEINMSNGQVLTMLDDLSLNGDLIVTNGTFRINDDATEQILNLLIKGNFEVSTHGSVTVGLADTRDGYKIQNPNRNVPDLGQFHSIFHQITLEGDLTNNGSIRLTNLDGPLYNEFADNGAVTFIFAGPRNPQKTELYGTTDFYNLIVNKGNDKTYIAEIYSENRDFFALYGSNSVGRRTGGTFTGENPEVRKALWIRNGTLKLEGSIWIPSLTEGNNVSGNGDYPIGRNGKLWIAGGDVLVYTTVSEAAQAMPNTAGINTGSGNQALSLYGTFRISNGFFGTRNSAGFVFWADASATVIIEGGMVDAAQYRSANSSGGGKTFHYQTGGEMIIRGSRTYDNGLTVESGGEPTSGHPLFGITEPDGVFQMSGGVITMISRLNNDDFHISAQDYSVTGGKLHIKVNGNETFVINSTSPVWDLEVERLNTNNTVQARFIRELTVLNDLILHDNTHLHARENNDAASPLFDLSVGRHFELGANAFYTAWNGVNTGNTTRFTGSENAELRLLNSADNNVFNVFSLEINKSTQDAEVVLVSPGRADATLTDTESPVNILNSLRVLSGVFDYDRFSLRSVSISGDVVIENRGTIGRIGSIGYLSVQVPEILVPFGSTPVFGRLLVDRGGSLVGFTGGANFTVGDLHMREGIIDIGTRSMTVYNEIHDDTENGEPFGLGKYIRMDGNHGDGGLIRRIWQNGDYFYPIGTQDRYAYADPVFSNVTDEGYVQINAVPNKLPTLGIVTGGNSDKYLNYYWRVRFSGFAEPNIPKVTNRFLTNPEDFLAGDWYHNLYLAGKVVNLERHPNDSEADDLYGEVQQVTRLILFYEFDLEEGEFTSARKQFFLGNIRVFYSKLGSTNWNGATWNSANNWSFVPHGEAVRPSIPNQNPKTNYPSAGDIAVISSNTGGGPGDGIHVYTSPSNLELAELRFIQESGKWSSRLRVERNHILNIGIVSGEGTIAPITRPGEYPVINADLSEFVNGERSVFNFILTANGDYEIPSYTSIYPNLRFEAQSGNITSRRAYFTHDVIIQRHLRVDWGSRFEVRTKTVVRGNLNLGDGNSSGRVQFSETNPQILEVGGITMTDRSGNIITVTGNNNLDHRLIVNGGNILQNHGTIDLFTNNTSGNNVVLEIRGDNDTGFDIVSGNLPSLYKMVIDKENSLNLVYINTNFTLNGPHDQVIPALELNKGTLVLNHAGIDVTLSSNEDYTITDEATLQVDQGQVRLTNGANLILRGGLELNGSSTAHFDSGNSSILYSSTGNALLSVADAATLRVGGQIRTGNNDNTKGVLRYLQTGGIVNAGSNAPSHEDYGVLEVFNPGSEFTFTGGELHILNSKGGTSRADLYLETSSAHVSEAGTVFIGSGGASGQTITLDTQGTPLPSLYVQGTNNKAQLRTSGLHLMGDLNIGADNSFDANDAAEASVFHNVRIEGDLINRGTVAIHTDTLFMQGNSQNILGNLELNHWVVDAETGISLDAGTTSSVIVNGNMHLERGTLATHTNDVIARGHVHNYGAFVGADTENGGLILTGTADQNLFGDGTFARLEINKPSGQAMLNGHLGMDNNLVLTNGNLHIGNYRLTLSESSRITGGDYGPGRMITTTGAESARGLVKHIGSGAGNFIFPLGVGNKYTPVEIVYTTNNNPGTLTVRPRNEKHITTTSLGGDVLQWHWLVNSHNLSNFSGTLTFEYDPVDVVGNIDEYLAARLLDDDDATWAKFPGQVNKDNHTFFIEFNGVDDVMGDYTAGIDPHIPANVPLYVSTSNGDWTVSSNWVREDDMTTPAPAGGPLGVRVRIEPGHTITIPGDQRVSYRTIIDGRLDLGSTMRHNLGRISGSGTLALSTGVLPGGDLNPFFQTIGSTLEYYGNGDIEHPASYPDLQNLLITGGVDLILPKTVITIHGNLDLESTSSVKSQGLWNLRGNVTKGHNAIFDINGNRVNFNGIQPQYISGNFTDLSQLRDVEINNNTGIYFDGDVTTSRYFYLSKGIVHMLDDHTLSLTFWGVHHSWSNIDFENHNSYISGRVTRRLNTSLTGIWNTPIKYFFPIGSSNKKRFVNLTELIQPGQYESWTLDYRGENPQDEMGANMPFTDEQIQEGQLEEVSQHEYWTVDGPSGSTVKMELTYDNRSWLNIGPENPTFDAQITLAMWNGSGWENNGSFVSRTGNEDYGSIQFENVSFTAKGTAKPFTFASKSSDISALPIELLSFTAQLQEDYVELEWVTGSETNNHFFTIERSRDGKHFDVVAVIASQAENGNSTQSLYYAIPDTQPMEGMNYYRLKQTDYDGSYEYSELIGVMYQKMEEVVFNLYPNPNKGNAFHIALNGLVPYEALEVSITSLQGRSVYHDLVNAGEAGGLHSYIVPSGRMTAGVYLVTVTGNSGRFVVRMVVN